MADLYPDILPLRFCGGAVGECHPRRWYCRLTDGAAGRPGIAVHRLRRHRLAAVRRDTQYGYRLVGRRPVRRYLAGFLRRHLSHRRCLPVRPHLALPPALYQLRETGCGGTLSGSTSDSDLHPSGGAGAVYSDTGSHRLSRLSPGGPCSFHLGATMTRTAMQNYRAAFVEAFASTFRAVFTDRAVVMVMVGAVILYSFFYPTGYQQQVASEQPVVIVDQDRTALSRDLIRHIERVSAVQVTALVASETEAIAQVSAMRAEGFVVIPRGFERDILRGDQGEVAIYAN